MRIFESQSGVVIKIGQNDKENDELIKTANQDYTWCHLDNQPSPHAVIESTSPDKESIKKKHLDKVSMVLNDNILFSKFAFENFFDILVQLICSVDPEETDAHMSSERTPQQAALSCMDLLIKAINYCSKNVNDNKNSCANDSTIRN